MSRADEPTPRPGRIRASLSLVLALCLGLGPGLALPVSPARADDETLLRAVLDRTARRDWEGARVIAGQAGPVVRDIAEWQRLRAGEGLLGDYEAFLERRPDWPGLALLRQRGETAVARSTAPDRVTRWFGGEVPLTGEGAVALVRALAGSGQHGAAEAEFRRVWADMRLSTAEEATLLSLVPPQPAAVHEGRLDRLLWQDRAAEAERMLPRVSSGWRALAAARMALRADGAGVDGLIVAVPAALAGDPGLAHERFLWRLRKGRTAEAAALLLERSESAAALGDAAAWAGRRPSLARDLMWNGDARTAYRVASRHWLDSGGTFADLEFLAGFAALRKLGDPETALGHFRRLRGGVSTAISLSRAHYWEGRALEAMGQGDAARAAYAEAARHQTAYYGLLAAERLGQSLDPALLDQRRPADWRGAGFARSSVLEAARLFLRVGNQTEARRFLLHLAEGLDRTGLDQLSDFVLAMDEPHIAVLIGKQAAERGMILPRAYYPIPALVPDGQPVSRALALSIARRESEFNPVVVSPAGARGLMQVMPGTARMMAEKTGQPYREAGLTGDPAYNVSLGTAYLAQLVQEFGPSVALIATGYNAGPGRPRRWITEFGDPRRPDVDVVDWVETIPFTETRTYVMRVAESLVIYRALLRGASGPVRITAELKG